MTSVHCLATPVKEVCCREHCRSETPHEAIDDVLSVVPSETSEESPYHGACPCLRSEVQRVNFYPQDAEFLDATIKSHQLFASMWGSEVERKEMKAETEASYYSFPEAFASQIIAAATELHRMFVSATTKVLEDDKLLERFHIPRELHGKIRASYQKGPVNCSGRFDLAWNSFGELKMFEYNADSASTLLECADIQDRWMTAVGIREGRTAGDGMLAKLVAFWGQYTDRELVHFFCDQGPDEEEHYTTQFMRECAERAGVKTKICVGRESIKWTDGQVTDLDGVKIKCVWKTWMWETVIDDYLKPKEVGATTPSLSDLLLDDGVEVLEPLWKVIPSNKAILPVLWEMYPHHPLLLRTTYDAPDNCMLSHGYVKKPIVGRCGKNVTVYKHGGMQLAESTGQFADRDHVYQVLFNIPNFHGYHPILGVWMVNSEFAGFAVREDRGIITTGDSPLSACKII